MNKLNKIIIASLATTTLALGLSACGSSEKTASESNSTPTTQVAKTATTTNNATLINNVSYSIGYGIGNSIDQDIQQHHIQLSNDQLKAGFEAGLSDQKPKFTDEQMQEIMTQYAQLMQQKQEAAQNAQASTSTSK